MNFNRAIIYGNLTRDPEVRQLPSGTQVANIGIATNRIYNNQQGEKVTEVEYHNVVAFGRTAELIQQYMKKGNGLLVEGRLRTSSWEADGVKKYKTEIIAENIQFGPKSGSAGDSTTDYSNNAGAENNTATTPQQPTINPDDIPF